MLIDSSKDRLHKPVSTIVESKQEEPPPKERTPREEFSVPQTPREQSPERDLNHISSAQNLAQQAEDDYLDD